MTVTLHSAHGHDYEIKSRQFEDKFEVAIFRDGIKGTITYSVDNETADSYQRSFGESASELLLRTAKEALDNKKVIFAS